MAVEGGSLIVNSVTDESGAVMKSKLHAGDRFYTPVELLV